MPRCVNLLIKCNPKHVHNAIWCLIVSNLTAVHFIVIIFCKLDSLFPVSKDYCERDTMHANCSEGEVVLMQEARYGQMKIGTCIKLNVDFVHCFRYVSLTQFLHHVPNNFPILHLRQSCWQKPTNVYHILAVMHLPCWMSSALVNSHVNWWFSWPFGISQIHVQRNYEAT